MTLSDSEPTSPRSRKTNTEDRRWRGFHRTANGSLATERRLHSIVRMYMRAFHVVKIDKKMEVRRTTSYPSLYSAIRAKIGRQDAVLASEE